MLLALKLAATVVLVILCMRTASFPRLVLQRPLILLRHAPSVYNSPAKVFTGWIDCPLVWPSSYHACGEAGILLHNFLRCLPYSATSSTSSSPLPINGLAAVYTSVLTRATDTCSLTLSVVSALSRRPTNIGFLPPGTVSLPSLNERHYGALSGLLKDVKVWESALSGRSPALRKLVGDAIHSWRREYDARPPPWSAAHPFRPAVEQDVRYGEARGQEQHHPGGPFAVPLSESLSDTSRRLEHMWSSSLLPFLTSSPLSSSASSSSPSSSSSSSSGAVLVVAHANTLRCVVKDMDGLSSSAVESLTIPAGKPFYYPAGTEVGGGGALLGGGRVGGSFRGTFLEDRTLAEGERDVVQDVVQEFMRAKGPHGREWEKDEIFRTAKIRTEEYARSLEWESAVPEHVLKGTRSFG